MGKEKKQKRLLATEKSVLATVDKLEQHLGRQETDEEYIHRLRVHIKHLRAWLRLLRIHKEHADWKTLDHELRDMARSLGHARDAQVVDATLQELLNYTVDEQETLAIEKLLPHSYDQVTTVNRDWPNFKLGMYELLLTLKAEFILAKSTKQVRKNLMRSYKRTAGSATPVFNSDIDFESLHQFRKNVKALNYQIGYINPAFDNKGKQIKRRLSVLGELLGKIHDLDLVGQFVRSLPPRTINKQDRAAAQAVTNRQLRKLLTECKTVFDEVFSVTPEKFVRQIT